MIKGRFRARLQYRFLNRMASGDRPDGSPPEGCLTLRGVPFTEESIIGIDTRAEAKADQHQKAVTASLLTTDDTCDSVGTELATCSTQPIAKRVAVAIGVAECNLLGVRLTTRLATTGTLAAKSEMYQA